MFDISHIQDQSTSQDLNNVKSVYIRNKMPVLLSFVLASKSHGVVMLKKTQCDCNIFTSYIWHSMGHCQTSNAILTHFNMSWFYLTFTCLVIPEYIMQINQFSPTML